MDFMEIVRERRSIRIFKDDKIDETSIQTILEAVKWSQSWANTQCWEIVLINDRQIKEKLQGTLPPTNPAFKAVVQAPVVMTLCGKTKKAGFYHGRPTTKFGDWMMYDLGIVTQNICLTAHALGLGTVVVGLFDHDKAGKIINVPEEYELVSMIPVGVPEKLPQPPKRREIEDFLHSNSF